MFDSTGHETGDFLTRLTRLHTIQEACETMEAQPRHPTPLHTLVTTGVDAAVGVPQWLSKVYGDVIGMCMREGEFLPPGW